ncbi:BREX-2 system adenine-specific DNA-methyltransferase PglX [Streptomyces sp. NPDC002730]|uniref:BREX-2 system adenine-specific DNA-methyltransferase PglX n=1 Tax=Streptomyces sp. NPDC002730 TaxID=3364662 RepID=UPI0036BFF06F
MIDRKALLADLIKQVKAVETDLGKQVKAVPEVGARLRGEYDQARKLGRTAATWNSWLDERVTQVAVAWVLGSVFVRFCEDNELIPEPYLAGTTAERRDLAEARYADYVATGEDPTYRGWLERSFAELGAGQAGKLLFDERHNPLFQIPLSHDGARALVDFWRERDEEGASLVHDFTDPLNEDGTKGWDTRFLGDLYQDLSEAARKTYALLQTPEFVEEFILDRTMDPVVRELGASFGELKMIDPTCGSGHFVLGAFRRLVRLWGERQPGRELHDRVRAALDSVHGVDINPFAVAIARFRLLMAAMAAANVRTLADANKYEWPLHLAIGDSLIKARQTEVGITGTKSDGELEFILDGEVRDELAEFSYATEDVHEHKGILGQGRYHVVVGNPPYITVKDKNLNALYRGLYNACGGTYALSVPFAQRFFELAKAGTPEGIGYGMVGQITANSFMKREFGTKLIEEYFRDQVELTEVIDTSGAYIPGHGTPTVILVGRRRSWKEGRTPTIRTVRSVQGEPAAPATGADGLVWKAIASQIDNPGSVSQWISVDNLDRDQYFGKQPWVLGDGGVEMLKKLEASTVGRLASLSDAIGRTTHTGLDDAFYLPSSSAGTRRVISGCVPVIMGDGVRDYEITAPLSTLLPYNQAGSARSLSEIEERFLWSNRILLQRRVDFGQTPAERGLRWCDHSMFFPKRYRTPLGIAFPFVGTHAHFVLDRGGRVFKQTAPVIKLQEGASEEEHLQLLGLLNSSTACFWLKQVSYPKGGDPVGGDGARVSVHPWSDRYEFTGGNVERFPLSAVYPTALASALDTLAQSMAATSPSALTTAEGPTPTATSLREARTAWHSTRARMIALQEELDWQVYSLYNLHAEDLRAPESDVPELALGQRAFEIVLARRVDAGEASGEWFKRHNSTPITEIPAHWPDTYKQVVQKRIDAIESSRAIGMVERPEYKRRWATDGWDALQEKALRSWLLDKIEDRDLWFQDERPTLLTRAQLTSALAANDDFVSVAALHAPRKELAAVVAELLTDEHVPFLPALRYKPTGLKKRADWEHVWDRQRQEDAAPDEPAKRKIRDSIPVPPKYTSADFLKPSYWRARGKLDVPKERFISYATTTIPGAPDLLGWAGWDHQEQAFAIVMHIATNPPADEELVPSLAGLLELQPWLNQWHGDFEALYSGSPASYFAGQRAIHQDRLGLTDDDLRAWRPAAPVRARRTTKGK